MIPLLSFIIMALASLIILSHRILYIVYQFFEVQVNIRSIDEAVVIGAALSLSSSAFVLQVSR